MKSLLTKPRTRPHGTFTYQISGSRDADVKRRFRVDAASPARNNIGFICRHFQRALDGYHEQIRPHSGHVVSHDILDTATVTELDRELGDEHSLESLLVHLDHFLTAQKDGNPNGPLKVCGMETHFFIMIGRVKHTIVVKWQPAGRNWRLELHEAQTRPCLAGSRIVSLPKRK